MVGSGEFVSLLVLFSHVWVSVRFRARAAHSRVPAATPRPYHNLSEATGENSFTFFQVSGEQQIRWYLQIVMIIRQVSRASSSMLSSSRTLRPCTCGSHSD